MKPLLQSIILAGLGVASAASFTEAFLSKRDASVNFAGKENNHFDALLDHTLKTHGLHRSSSSRGNHSQFPIPEQLFITGQGINGGLQRARRMTKVPDKNAWQITTRIMAGGLLFVPSKQSLNGAFGAQPGSAARQQSFCTKCGLDANLALRDAEGSIDVPGPTAVGVYQVVVDFDAGTVKYRCRQGCWPKKNFVPDVLYAVGPSICGEWSPNTGPPLAKEDNGDSIKYRATLHLCPGNGFKFVPNLGSRRDDMGLWATSYVDDEESSGDHFAKDGHGHLRMFQDQRIPGPLVESWYNFTLDFTEGTFEMHCVDMCDGPHLTNYARFEATNAPEPGEAFVHLFSWRWDDIATECEQFLGPKGVKAVQIAPPQESKVPPRPSRDSWSYVYRPISYRLDSRLGTEDQLKSMIERCSMAGVDIYFDAVLNHMAAGRGTGSGGSSFQKYNYPAVGFVPEDFHHLPGQLEANCRIDVLSSSEGGSGCDAECERTCEFNGMPDLDTSSPKVQQKLRDYLNKVLDLGAAGFRVDAADHIGEHDLHEIFAGVRPKYRFQESREWNDTLPTGAVTQFQYRRRLMGAITDGDISQIHVIGEPTGLAPSKDAVVMIVNHDAVMTGDARGFGIIYKQPHLYTLGHVVMMAHPYGYPKVMSSYYFPDGEEKTPAPAENVHGPNGELRCGDGVNWVCEHRWPAIANMFRFRKAAGSSPITHFTVDPEDHKHAYFCRGERACIIINVGTEPWAVQPTRLTVPAGTYCNVFVSDDAVHCPTVSVANGTTATEIVVPAVSAVAFHTEAMGPDASLG